MAPPASSASDGIEEEIAVDRDGYDSSNATKTVCVMDASGHFASALVRRLLLRGYTVHAALHNHGINLLLHFFLSLSFFFFFIIFISSIQFLIFFFFSTFVFFFLVIIAIHFPKKNINNKKCF